MVLINLMSLYLGYCDEYSAPFIRLALSPFRYVRLTDPIPWFPDWQLYHTYLMKTSKILLEVVNSNNLRNAGIVSPGTVEEG